MVHAPRQHIFIACWHLIFGHFFDCRSYSVYWAFFDFDGPVIYSSFLAGNVIVILVRIRSDGSGTEIYLGRSKWVQTFAQRHSTHSSWADFLLRTSLSQDSRFWSLGACYKSQSPTLRHLALPAFSASLRKFLELLAWVRPDKQIFHCRRGISMTASMYRYLIS